MISLTHQGFSISVVPELGGGLSAFQHDGVDIFRSASAASLSTGDMFGLACFPMVPFVGRIRQGRVPRDGKAVFLPSNHAGHPYPLHGFGWQQGWDVLAQGRDFCRLSHRYSEGAWPWSYRAEQLYRLTETGLSMRLSVTNESAEPMPLTVGQHPYFPRSPGCSIHGVIREVLLPESDLVADHASPVPVDWGFATGHPVGAVELDHCFSGWQGPAELRWPDRPFNLKVSASTEGRFLQIYCPKGQDIFCFEPMTGVPDAVNWAAQGSSTSGLVQLPPGAQFEFESQFDLMFKG